MRARERNDVCAASLQLPSSGGRDGSAARCQSTQGCDPTGHRSAYREALQCGAPAGRGRLGVSRLTVTAMHHDHDAGADQFHGSSNTLSVSSSLPHWAPGPSDLLVLGRFSLESSLMVRNEPEFPDLTRLTRPDASADPAGRRPAGGESPSWRCMEQLAICKL